MNIVNKLTFRHLKENKRRSIITVCGIIISVAMITAVTSSAVSFMGMMGKALEVTGGDWAGVYNNVSAENIDIAKKDKNFDSVIVSRDEGTMIVGDTLNKDNILSVRSQQPDTYETVKVHLYEGTYPKAPNEIVVSNNFITLNQLDWKVGDTISLNSITRMGEYPSETEGEPPIIMEKTQFERFATTDTATVTGSREYKLVGIINNSISGTLRNYNAVTGLDMSALDKKENVDIFMQSQNPKMGIATDFTDLFDQMDKGEDSKMSINGERLAFSGAVLNASAISIYGLAGIIMVLIFIASVVMIYNAFAISIGERSRYLGMLASVGATKRQKRNTVYFEGAILGAIGIPLGIISGLAGIGITFKFIDPLMQNMVNDIGETVHMTLKVSLAGILISVLLGAVTIFVSAYVPGRIASKTTAIDAIRKSNQIRVKPKALKTSKLTRKIFGFDGELAKKNQKRNKKKYNVIAMSLALSVTLFIGVTAFTNMLTSSLNMVKITSNSDINIDTDSEEYSKTIEDYIKSLSGVDSYKKYMATGGVITATNDTVADYDKLVEMSVVYKDESGTGQMAMVMQINGLEDEEFKKYCESNGIDSSEYFDINAPKVVVENEIRIAYYQDNEPKVWVGNPLNVNAGDKLDFSGEVRETNDLTKTAFSVGTVLSKSSEKTPPQKVNVFLPASVLSQIVAQNNLGVEYKFEINSSDPLPLYKKIGEAQSAGELGKCYINSPASSEQSSRSMVTILSVFVYGFITLMSMVSVTNIFNTISTGMNTRRREFAMLKSVGMTPKAFKKMIYMESVFYGIKALLIGLTCGFLVNLAMYYSVGLTLQMPIAQAFNPWMYLTAVVAVAVVVGTALIYSFRKVKKDNIIETIKSDDN